MVPFEYTRVSLLRRQTLGVSLGVVFGLTGLGTRT